MVLDAVTRSGVACASETVPIGDACGRVLAADVLMDRDSPPVARSVRDGFAVRSADLPGGLRVVGEVRAGEAAGRAVASGEAIEIMTGAPVPDGADCIVMVEHVRREGGVVHVERTQQPGDFINAAGSEARAGDVVLTRGARVTFPRVSMLAAVGCAQVPVYRKPVVAVLSTGDEVIPVEQSPEPFQVRNSNAWTVAAQLRRTGAEARILPVARDVYDHTRTLMEEGLAADMLVLTGGVSAGKYDIVEQVLAELGAEFYFTRVKIQPGAPLVFGHVRGKFFFGLPGNPASVMVTYEIFARAAVELLMGLAQPELPFAYARLTREFRHKPGLMRFLPARLAPDGLEVTPIAWSGSSDIAALARGNCFLVVDAERESWAVGELMPVLLQ
ncbi:MAG: molybdopterin molybdotransferase MoeA [Acidobacteria bacterium]|nr:molybdopterin molybdotransferase MoeA [Acidobacteriota bacterium]